MSKKQRRYELYPTFEGFVHKGFTNQSREYQGEVWSICAVSNKQAHFFAHEERWRKEPGGLGIVSIYIRPKHQCWDKGELHYSTEHEGCSGL